jgi:hypothetical protein
MFNPQQFSCDRYEYDGSVWTTTKKSPGRPPGPSSKPPIRPNYNKNTTRKFTTWKTAPGSSPKGKSHPLLSPKAAYVERLRRENLDLQAHHHLKENQPPSCS